MIPIAEPLLGKEELRNATQAIKSGWVSSKGKFITEFEEGFARFCGVKYGVATANGTVALHLALVALRIGKGDEVIVPALTFVATASAVTYTGARVVFVDSHPDYWCIDPERIERKITKRTKAIIPVHLYGHPCDMDPIMDIAKRHSLYVIEDAAEAHGAEYKGRKVGSFGDINCFSFYGNKNITTGEGGMCLTNDEKLTQRMKILRDHGMNPDKSYWHDIVGFNYRMTNMQAAIGVAQVNRLDEFVIRKKEIAKIYNSLLKNVNGVTLPLEMPWAKSVYWMYSILTTEDRDDLMKQLQAQGIETRPFFYPLHLLPPYKSDEELPVATKLSVSGISLPSGVTLREEDVRKVGQAINKIIGKLS